MWLHFTVLVHSHWFSSVVFGHRRHKKLQKPAVHYLLSTKWKTDTVNYYQVNIAEHLAAEEADGRDKKANTKTKMLKGSI